MTCFTWLYSIQLQGDFQMPAIMRTPILSLRLMVRVPTRVGRVQVPGDGGEDVEGGGEMRWKLGPSAPGERPASPGGREAAWQSQ